MKHQKLLEKLINELCRPDRILLFGENSKIKLTSITFSTQKKCYIVDLKLTVDEPELCEESYPDGLYHLVKTSFEWIGEYEKVIIVSSLEVI
jgi:hypothetical protein